MFCMETYIYYIMVVEFPQQRLTFYFLTVACTLKQDNINHLDILKVCPIVDCHEIDSLAIILGGWKECDCTCIWRQIIVTNV